jgi:hypothetical protein
MIATAGNSGSPKSARGVLFYTSTMKFFLSLLLALAFSVNAFAAAAAQTRVCCDSDECSVVQCLDMGCLPAASPLASHSLVAFITQVGTRAIPVKANDYLPNWYKEIWTPPD